MADIQNISLDSPGSVGAVAVPVVFALIFLLGMVGNGLVLAVLLQPGPSAWQEPGSTTDLFILNLAVADLCFILCCVPFQAAIYTLDAWLFGAFVCKTVHLLIYLTMYASSFTLAAVSVDRYLAVRHPLRSRALRTPRNARAAVGLVWLLAALFSAPYLSYYGTVRYGALELCVPAWEDARRRALDVATFAAGYLLPVTVVSLAYGRTLCFLWAAVGPAGAAAAEARRRATGRAGRAMLTVAALYALCWGPHHALILCFWYGRFAFSPATYACRLGRTASPTPTPASTRSSIPLPPATSARASAACGPAATAATATTTTAFIEPSVVSSRRLRAPPAIPATPDLAVGVWSPEGMPCAVERLD
ncbi:galanin receptor 3 [Mus musculus]|nr:galanin receptor 3 [Mus musculus]